MKRRLIPYAGAERPKASPAKAQPAQRTPHEIIEQYLISELARCIRELNRARAQEAALHQQLAAVRARR